METRKTVRTHLLEEVDQVLLRTLAAGSLSISTSLFTLDCGSSLDSPKLPLPSMWMLCSMSPSCPSIILLLGCCPCEKCNGRISALFLSSVSHGGGDAGTCAPVRARGEDRGVPKFKEKTRDSELFFGYFCLFISRSCFVNLMLHTLFIQDLSLPHAPKGMLQRHLPRCTLSPPQRFLRLLL